MLAGADTESRCGILGLIATDFRCWFRPLQLPDHRATGNFNQQILAGVSIHAIAHAKLAVLGEQAGLIILGYEIIQIVVGFQNDAAAASAVPTAGTALGTILLALKGDTTFPAVTRPRVNFNFVYEHGNQGCD